MELGVGWGDWLLTQSYLNETPVLFFIGFIQDVLIQSLMLNKIQYHLGLYAHNLLYSLSITLSLSR